MRCKVKVTVVDATDFSFVLTRRGWGMLHNVFRALSWATEAIGAFSSPLLVCRNRENNLQLFSALCVPWIRNSVCSVDS